MAFSLPFKRGKSAKPDAAEKAEPALEAPVAEEAAATPPEAAPAAEGIEPPAKKASPLSKFSSGKGKKAQDGDAASSGKRKKKLAAAKKRNRFVLMIGDDGGILVYIEKGQVTRRVYAPSAEKQHIKPFVELLNAHPKVPLYVMCDMVDQSYVRHTLPPVSPLSIKKLVDRRLNRDFAPEDIKGSLSLGREKTGRKEWNFMLISLANSDALQQWMDPILELPNRCVGLYLVPVESQGLLRNFSEAVSAGEDMAESQWKILVTHDKVAGFRQVVLKDGLLIFTRLTQLSGDTPPEVMAGNIEQEVQNTIEYLRRMSFDEADGLDVFVIVAQDVRDLLEAQKMGASQVKMFTPFEASKLLQLPQAALSGDRFADVIMSANFAMRQKGALKLLPGYAKKLDQIYQAMFGIKVVGALAVLYLLYSSAMAFLGWQGASGELTDEQSRLNSEQASLQQTERRYDALGDDQTRVMRVSALYRKTERPPGSPIDFAESFGQIKGANVRVLNWAWAEAKPEAASEPQGNRRGRAKPKEQTKKYSITARIEILDHNGDVRILSQNVRAMMERVQAAFPDYEVTRSMLPEERAEAEKESTVVIDLNQPAPVQSYEVKPGDQYIELELTGPNPSKAKS